MSLLKKHSISNLALTSVTRNSSRRVLYFRNLLTNLSKSVIGFGSSGAEKDQRCQEISATPKIYIKQNIKDQERR